MDILYTFKHGDFVLIATFVTLIILSILSWGVVISKSLEIKKEKFFLKNLNKNVKESSAIPANFQPFLSKQENLDDVRIRLKKGMTLLSSTASASPFIGLFGTVWGIYKALLKISLEGNANLATVAAPMGEALVATAFGLFVAIPALLAYNAFVAQNQVIITKLKNYGF